MVEDTGLMEHLELKKGAKVIIVRNDDIYDNLVNGVAGTVIDFVYRKKPGIDQTMIHAILVLFDDLKIGEERRRKFIDIHPLVKSKHAVPIFRKTQQFNRSKYYSKKKHSDKCSVEQFPLNLSYASTSHKLQGRTLRNTDVVCHSHKHLPKGCAYVMLSRCTSIANVFLAEDFDLSKIKPDEESLLEAKKLAQKCIAVKLKKEKFDIFYVNMQGKSHFIDVIYDLYAQQSDVVCLVETWLQPNEQMEWPERKLISHASFGHGKGVSTYTNDHQNKLMGNAINENFQIVQQLIMNTVQLFVIYISKGANMEDIAQCIQEMLDPDLDTMILGDFNFESKKPNSLSIYLNNKLNLQQIITGPTFTHGPNTIDHLYVSENLRNVELISRFPYYSSHMAFNISFKKSE